MTTISLDSCNPSNSLHEEQRDWLKLPSDVTLAFMMKLGALEILDSAQFVCKSWYNLCKDPFIWRTIHIEHPDPLLIVKHEKRLLSTVDRSIGGLIDLNTVGFASDKLLSYVASRSSQLKRLRLVHCPILSDKATTEAIEKLSSLEELELTLCSAGSIQFLSRLCSSLMTLKLNNMGSRNPLRASDVDAFAIAESMPELRHLQLIGNDITDVGLEAILDGCRHLESLDLRACFHLKLEGNLKHRLSQQINHFRHLGDSTEDYDYDVEDIYDCEDEYDFDFDSDRRYVF